MSYPIPSVVLVVMVQLVNKSIMSLIILGLMVLCGASVKTIGITAIALGALHMLLTSIIKIIQNQNSHGRR